MLKKNVKENYECTKVISFATYTIITLLEVGISLKILCLLFP